MIAVTSSAQVPTVIEMPVAPAMQESMMKAHRAWSRRNRAGIDCKWCHSRIENHLRKLGSDQCQACENDDAELGWGR